MKEQIKDEANKNNEKKMPYEKPQLNEVKLFAEQVLSGTCQASYPSCNDTTATS
jgi:hypothetical protein